MRFRVLGPLRVWDGSSLSQIQAAQQRAVLAILLMSAGRAVTTDRVIYEIWGERPPRAAVATVQGYVMRLRRLLGGGTAGPLLTRGSGYELSIEDEDLDASVFERLVESGQRSLAEGKPEAAATSFAEGLALWRGPALVDVPLTPTVTAEASRLAHARLTALEGRLAAQLDLGGHTDVVDELHALVAEHPLRERLWAFLMTALCRCGRRAEALAAYREIQQRLVTDLGLEPGQELRELQAAILADDGDLAIPSRGAANTTTIGGTAVPAELPADVAAFTGREAACTALDALVPTADPPRAAPVTVVIAGTAGVGKTALAVHWSHRVADRFPDGQLYVNLEGYATGPPLPPVRALARFLRALGVPPATVPVDVAEAAAMYRSLLARRRMLVLLDNAGHPDQVRPLLPAGPGCLALVTSRDRLAGLVARDGAVPMALDVLTGAEARTLLTRLIGAESRDRDPEAIAALADRCGYLPLALRIAVANLATRPGATVAEYAALLAGDDRLDALQVDGDAQAAVRVAFAHSYAALPPQAQRLFRLLGLVPGPDVTAAAAGALAGVPPGKAIGMLRRLTGACLLDGHRRYVMHDLTREYAAEQAAGYDSEADRRAALSRLYDHYLRRTAAAADKMYRHVLRLPLPGPPQQPGSPHETVEFDDHAAAAAWLDAERANLVAAVTHAARDGFAETAWLLADALRGYLYVRMYTVDWLLVGTAGLAAAEAAGDIRAKAAAQAGLATLHWAQGRHETATAQFTVALDLARRAGWEEGESAALGNLGNLCWATGRLAEAADHYTRVLALCRRSGQVAREATALGNLALVYLQQGELSAAEEQCLRALDRHRRGGSPSGEARILTHLGEIRHARGRLADALTTLSEAESLLRAIGDRNIEGDTIRTLAAVHCDAGRLGQALDLATAAVNLARETGDRRVEAGASATQAGVRHRLGQHERAVAGYQQAVHVARTIGNRYLETEALLGLAAVAHDAGQHDEAASHARQAHDIARRCDYRLLAARAAALS